MPIMTARIKANIKHLSPGCSDFMHALKRERVLLFSLRLVKVDFLTIHEAQYFNQHSPV